MAKVDKEALGAAVRRFVETFVDKERRERIAAALLHRKQDKVVEAIQSLYRLVDERLQHVFTDADMDRLGTTTATSST